LIQIVPAVNQIEFHPYSLAHYLPALLPLCKEHNIVIECYAPLMSITRHIGGPVDEAVAEVIKARAVEPTQSWSALKMGAEETAGQILLMWAQQVSQGVVLT
jgi:diketogulonate reductase-like aldo/keto reductase